MERKSHQLFNNCPWEKGISVKAAASNLTGVGNYRPRDDVGVGPVDLKPSSTIQPLSNMASEEIFKAYIPWFLYKPPYGFPRDVNVLQLRQFAKNPYIFSVIKTIQDEVCSVPYDIVLKDEYIKNGFEEDEESRKGILNFFENPNGNFESFEHIQRAWINDICTLDSGIGVKVFDKQGKFRQLFARDGGTFLKNTDIYGYIGNRADFVPAPSTNILTGGIPTDLDKQLLAAQNTDEIEAVTEKSKNQQYDALYRDTAAYFQYGWTAGARPVPFGKREIMWIELNPRTDSIYGRSPIEILLNQILTLVYGSEYNLDFYLNNNLPNGLLHFKGASSEQAEAYRQQMESRYMAEDEFGTVKKKHFKVPITGYEATFTQMQMTSKEMEVIEQQKWFTKLVWSCFGVTAEEMGFTEDSNKATAENQSKVTKRRAIKPYLTKLAYVINNQLMPEFGHPEYEFKYIEEDVEADMMKQNLWEQQIRMGIRSSQEIREKELGIAETLEEETEEGDYTTDSDDKENDDFPQENKKETENKAYTFEKEISINDLEKDLKLNLNELKEMIIEDVRMQLDHRGLGEIKGYIDVKSIFKDTLEKFISFFKDKAYKKKVNDLVTVEFNKGVKEVEDKVDQDIPVTTSTQKFVDLSEYVFENIVDMNEETVNKLRKEISMAIMNRETFESIKNRIIEVFNIAEDRAITIARTEGNRAYNMGANQAARESGLKLKKKWDSHVDTRTSKVCKDLDGQIVDMNEKFKWEGKEFDFPPAHPNCRSRVLYIQDN